ncbi:hypothetical protein PFNF135_02393 [Plasmodium falciparum NF135/5.C10]|nr:hypothetical protein PFNF135_02393 [Plasmodium falciparum NF135/5.C10]
MLNVLKGLIQKYLDNDIDEGFERGRGNIRFLYERIWKQNLGRIYEIVGTKEEEHTKNFLNLINREHTLDDILKFIYSFLDHFDTLKKELHEETQKELLFKIAQCIRILKY